MDSTFNFQSNLLDSTSIQYNYKYLQLKIGFDFREIPRTGGCSGVDERTCLGLDAKSASQEVRFMTSTGGLYLILITIASMANI
jgi:hypothetical protein